MLKKLIASALSATFLCSSVMLDRIVDTSIVRDVPLADNSTILNNNEKEVKDDSNGQYDIKATNSLGNYITHMAADHNSNNSVSAAPLSTDGKFEVSSLEFDNVTGNISVCSSQTSSCIVEISFINDETGEMSLKVSQAVEAGEYVKTKTKADLFKLPQFYKINAQLVDKMGNPISNVFHENKYTKAVQDIIATDIHDFEAERVVNLDESEQTNFLVLNEKTIKAESTEIQNTLVSADYENNTFVFNNIDDSIKDLQDGDLFYIQPTKNDIIAISVDNISIDGDKATLSGTTDIDKMFEFVKIETDTDGQEATVNTETADPNISFPGHEDEKQFTYDMGKGLDIIYNKQLSFFDIPVVGDIAEGVCDGIEDVGDGLEAIYDKVTDAFNIDYSANNTNNYTINDRISVEKTLKETSHRFVDAVKATIPDYNLTINGFKGDSFVIKDEKDPNLSVEFGIFGLFSMNVYHNETFYSVSFDFGVEARMTLKYTSTLKNFDLMDLPVGKIIFHTSIPGVLATMNPNLVFNITMATSVTFKIGCHFIVRWDSDSGWNNEFDPTAQREEKEELKVQAKVFFGIRLDPGVELISDGLISARFRIQLGLELIIKIKSEEAKFKDGELSISENIWSDIDDHSLIENALFSDYNNIAIMNTDKDSVHYCDNCFDCVVNLVATADGTIKIFGKALNLSNLSWKEPNKSDKAEELFGEKSVFSMTIPLRLLDFTISYPHGELKPDIYKKDREEKCKHRMYKVEIRANDPNNIKNLSKIKVTLDGLTQNLDSNGIARFYCANGEYYYYVTCNGKRIDSGYITVEDGTLREWLEMKISEDSSGNENVSITNIKTENGAKYKIKESEPDEMLPKQTTSKIDSNQLISETIKLGDNILALAYPDGHVNIYGSGEMYDYKYSSPFKNIDKIKKVYIYDADPANGMSITSIGGGVFKGAENLEGIYLSNKITKIGDSAFSGCKNLKWFRYGGFKDTTTTFNLPTELETIGNYAFADCKQFTSITVPNKTIFVGDQAFDGCIALANVVIGKNVKTIGKNAFNMCSSLQSLTLPSADFDMYEADASNPNGGYVLNKPTPIYMLFNWYNSNDKFYATSQNKNLFVPKSLKTIKITGGEKIGEKAFRGMYELENITIPSTIKEIGNNAFEDCNKVKKITLPAGLRVIGNSAFTHCDSAVFNTNVIPSSVASIGYDAFAYCKKIETLVIPKSTKKIYPSAFYGCENLKRAIIKDGIEILGESMFDECRALTNLTLPSTEFKLQTIGNGVLDSAPVYTLFKCDWNPNSGYYRSYDSHYKVHNALNSITITGGTKINAGAFRGMASLENIHIPDSITEIGDHAFDECTALTALTLPENLTKIGDSAFRKCYVAEFNSNTIPAKVESIGAYAFEYCYMLKSITIPGNVESIGRNAFDGCKNITSAIIKNGVKTIGENIFDNCTSLKSLSLPFAGLSLDDVNNNEISTPIYHLFKHDWNNCEGFYRSYETEYKVPETLTSIAITGGNKIPEGAFRGMKKLTTITLPSTITKIGDHAFDGTGLTKVNINSSEAKWNNVVIDFYNEPLVMAAKTFKTVTISAHPANVTVDCGQTATFKVTAKGDSLTYQWQYSIDNGKTWKNTGTSKNTYNIKTTDKQNNYLYRCVITDKYGTKKSSNSAKLTVKPVATTTVTTTAKKTTKATTKATTTKTTAKTTSKATTSKTTAKTTTKATTAKTTAKTTTKATTAKTTAKTTTKATTAKTSAKTTTKATTAKTTAKTTTKATTAKTSAKATSKTTTATI